MREQNLKILLLQSWSSGVFFVQLTFFINLAVIFYSSFPRSKLRGFSLNYFFRIFFLFEES